ncbi:MAG: phosphotransferase [Labilithrix sp.]|nr:phosphotransferase [Labilithrix sp.]
MEAELRWIAEATGARDVRRGDRIQSLWGGYGELLRVRLVGAEAETAILKWVKPPALKRSPKGASPDASHARKCRSYDVETAWYRDYAARCDDSCRVPARIASRVANGEWLLLLEDLDAAGFPERRRSATGAELDVCLAWLAAFHARFLGVAPAGLWRSGTYWHLATRADELAAIDDDALREAAPELDRRLRSCAYATLVHGDAKLANFCFARRGGAVAAVDFQYVGGGTGMKDVAYLLCGHFGDDALERRHLDGYFRHLRAALALRAEPVDADALVAEWRALYPIACADYYRFLAGWSKAHWRSDAYGQRLVRDVLRSLS